METAIELQQTATIIEISDILTQNCYIVTNTFLFIEDWQPVLCSTRYTVYRYLLSELNWTEVSDCRWLLYDSPILTKAYLPIAEYKIMCINTDISEWQTFQLRDLEHCFTFNADSRCNDRHFHMVVLEFNRPNILQYIVRWTRIELSSLCPTAVKLVF